MNPQQKILLSSTYWVSKITTFTVFFLIAIGILMQIQLN